MSLPHTKKKIRSLMGVLNLIKFSNYLSLYTKWDTYDKLRKKKKLHDNDRLLKTSGFYNFVKSLFDVILGLFFMPVISIVEIVMVLFLYLVALFRVKRDPIVKGELVKYIKNYGYSGVCGIKFLEGRYFRAQKIERPAVEIGIARGETSNLHFKGKRFDLGSEYIYEDIKENPFSHWKYKIVSDFRALPFKTGSIESLFSVHVIDAIKEEELEDVIQEVSRVLKTSGRFVFSGFGEAYYRLPFYTRFSRFLGLAGFTERLERHRFVNFHCYNLYSRETWSKIAGMSNLTVERHVTFGGRPISILFYNIHQFVHKYTRLLKFTMFSIAPFLERIWVNILAACFLLQIQGDRENDDRDDLFFFAVLKKSE